jgi:hypothetical protein
LQRFDGGENEKNTAMKVVQDSSFSMAMKTLMSQLSPGEDSASLSNGNVDAIVLLLLLSSFRLDSF